MTALGDLIEVEKSTSILTYPKNMVELATLRIRKLTELGIVGIYNYGPSLVNGFRVLGKGHSSIVLLARHETLGNVAVKIRRVDSKRDSLAKEGYLMSLDRFNVVPKVYYFDDDVIIMEFLRGVTLGDYLRIHNFENESLPILVMNMLTAAYRLDLDFIDHLELANPHKHVFVLDDVNVKVIDFESARISEKPCNLCRIASYIVNLLKIEDISYVRATLREYKLGYRDVFPNFLEAFKSMITQLNGVRI